MRVATGYRVSPVWISAFCDLVQQATRRCSSGPCFEVSSSGLWTARPSLLPCAHDSARSLCTHVWLLESQDTSSNREPCTAILSLFTASVWTCFPGAVALDVGVIHTAFPHIFLRREDTCWHLSKLFLCGDPYTRRERHVLLFVPFHFCRHPNHFCRQSNVCHGTLGGQKLRCFVCLRITTS